MLVGTNFSKNIFQQTSFIYDCALIWFKFYDSIVPIQHTAEKKWFLSLNILGTYNSWSNLTIVHFQRNPPAGEWLKSTREILWSTAVTCEHSWGMSEKQCYIKVFQSYFMATTHPNVDKRRLCDPYLHDTYGFSWKVIRCVREES